MTTYEIRDRIPGAKFPEGYRNIRAIMTGEKRAPRKDEWYISGAIPEAYRASNDLSMIFHIARLVKVETKTVETIVGLA